MSLQKKLLAWQEAGLIDGETRERILQHEHGRARPYALYIMGGLGVLAVVLGIITLVAANWDEIPRLVKMGMDLGLMTGLAWAILHADERDRPWVREMLLLLYVGLALASIALMGQTYQLGGKPWQALMVWTAMVLPALLVLGHRMVSAVAVVVAVDTTLVIALMEWMDRAHVGERWEAFVVGCLVAWLPLGHAAAYGWPALRRWRADLARVAGGIGWPAVVLGSFAAQHFWYAHIEIDRDGWSGLAMVVPLVLGLGLWMGVLAGRGTSDRRLVLSYRVLLAYTVLAALVPVLLPHGRAGVLSAVSVIGYSAVLAWSAYLRHQIWLFNLATAAVALRVLIVFIELFGSMVDTGIGLIVGGILTLVIAGVWVRQTAPLRKQMRQPGGAP